MTPTRDRLAQPLRRAIVRVLKGARATAGTGFFVSGNLIATCAHVAEEVRNSEITVELFDGKPVKTKIRDGTWCPPEEGDVVLLEVRGELPPDILVLNFGSSAACERHNFQTYGFPDVQGIDGLPDEGTILGKTKKTGTDVPLLHLRTDNVTGGFSGAPVYDIARQRVVGIISDTIDRDLRGRLGGSLAVASELLRPFSTEQVWNDRRPYVGLKSFEETQADIFCSRTVEVDRLLERIRAVPRFLAVLGPSGSGKSSIVHAGAVPRLRTEPAFDRWDIGHVRGGSSDFSLKIADAAQHSGPQRLLLIVDQFEEIFTAYSPGAQRELLAPMEQLINSAVPVTVLIVMRDDFYSRLPQECPGLAPRLEDSVVYMAPRLSRGDILEIIRKPAQQAGFLIETGLAERIADDAVRLDPLPGPEGASARTTILPLLEFTLDRLFENREDGMLVNGAYPSAGVTSMLGAWARDTYQGLPPPLDVLAKRMFTELLQVADENEAVPLTRRRRLIRELSTDEAERNGIEQLILKFTAARLLVTDRPKDSEATVEIIHESLIRSWTDLSDWARQRRDFLLWRAAVKPRVDQWNKTGADDSLLRGLEISGLNPAFEDEMSEGERSFLIASREAQRNREEMERERRIQSESRELAAAAFTHLRTDPELSLMLAVAAVGCRETPEAYDALQESVAASRVRRTIAGHGRISSVVFNRDGDLLLLACGDGQARIVRSTGELVCSLPGALGELAVATFNDGRETMIAAASMDGRVRIWNWSAADEIAEIVRTWSAHDAGAYTAAFHATRNLIATGGADGEIRIRDIDTEKVVSAWRASRKVVHSLAFHPEGGRLAAGCGDNALRVWNWEHPEKPLFESQPFDDHVSAIVWSPDGRQLAAACYDGTARIYRFENSSAPEPSGAPLVLQVANNWLLAIAFDGEGKRLATGGFDCIATVWEAATGKLIAALQGHKDRVTGVSFFGDQLATAGADAFVRIWDVSEIPDRLTVVAQDERLFTCGFHRSGVLFFTASDSNVRFWDVTARRQLTTFAGINAAFNPDSSQAAVVRSDRVIEIRDVQTGETRQLFRGQDGWTADMAWRSDGKQIATCGSNEQAALFNLNAPEHPILLTLHTDWVNGLAYRRDGKVLATTSNDRTVRLWSTETGDPTTQYARSVLAQHTHWIHGVCFDSTGTRLATASHDGTVRWWDLITGKASVCEGHTDWVRDVDISPSDDLLASCGKDKTICIWNPAASLRPIRVIRGHADEVWKVEFLDRRTLASVSWDRTARLWDVETGTEIAIFRSVASPRLYTPYSPDGESRLYRIELKQLIALAEQRITRTFTPWERRSCLHQPDA